VAFDPWDVAFGSALMNDYVFRGVTQSNHKASVAAYFEPRYNINKDLQLYGRRVRARAFPSPTAPPPKSTSTAVSARPSAPFRLRHRRLGLPVSGRKPANFGAATDFRGEFPRRRCAQPTPCSTANTMKKDVSFFEVYGKGKLHRQRQLAVSAVTEFLHAEFPELRRLG